MGLFKGILFGLGVPVRITTKKQRLYRRQMGYPETAGEAFDNLISRVVKGGAASQNQQVHIATEATAERRVPCPTCAEMIMPAAVMCRYCNKPTNFTAVQRGQQKSKSSSSGSTPQNRNSSGKPRSGQAARNGSGQAASTKCPACRRSLSKGATICRFCKKAI